MDSDDSKLRVLFICSQNRMRSPTAEAIFNKKPNISARSAGIHGYARRPLTPELLAWADIVFVMEKIHRDWVRNKFTDIVGEKRIICLYIPDVYEFMSPELISLLEEKVPPHLSIDLIHMKRRV